MMNRGEDISPEIKRLSRENQTAILMDICFCLGWRMNLYLSMAIMRMEKEEKKTQVAWKLPTNLQMNS
jgi:hypothetical protein